MKYIDEKESEDFLEREGFDVVSRSFCSNKRNLDKSLQFVGAPFVMKVAGKKIIHKNKLSGVRLNINNYSEALEEFNSLKKIKGAEGVLIQRKVKFDKEFLIGIKKTPEFGHVLVFGRGGTDVEEEKDVSFRVCPLDKLDIKKMIKDTQVSRGMLEKEGKILEEVILKICKLVEKYPNISELDINPLVIVDEKDLILDARMVGWRE